MRIIKILFICLASILNAKSQVIISNTPPSSPIDTSAVLELRGFKKGFLLTKQSNSDMLNTGNPADGLMVYNIDKQKPYFYNGLASSWQALSSDTSQWIYKPLENKIYFKKALELADSIFYDIPSRKFVFADDIDYTNSLGQTFPVTNFNGKYYFKSQASKMNMPINSHGTLVLVTEVDSITSDSNAYSGLFLSTITNPTNNQYATEMNGINTTTIHAGQDTIELLNGIRNSTIARGNGHVNLLIGDFNTINFSNLRDANTDETFGIYNSLTASTNPSLYSIGNIYGINTLMNANIVNRATGNVYGHYIGSVFGNTKPTSRQYAIYTNLGNNRFGDSTIISKTNTIPRAILDINSTESMIIPTGTTAQRPTLNVKGQQRFNSETNAIESYNGFEWIGITSFNVAIAVPNLAANGGLSSSVTVTGAKVGDVIVITPKSAMPAGYGIAWANVSAANTVEVRFMNYSTAAITGYTDTFYVKIIR